MFRVLTRTCIPSQAVGLCPSNARTSLVAFSHVPAGIRNSPVAFMQLERLERTISRGASGVAQDRFTDLNLVSILHNAVFAFFWGAVIARCFVGRYLGAVSSRITMRMR